MIQINSNTPILLFCDNSKAIDHEGKKYSCSNLHRIVSLNLTSFCSNIIYIQNVMEHFCVIIIDDCIISIMCFGEGSDHIFIVSNPISPPGKLRWNQEWTGPMISGNICSRQSSITGCRLEPSTFTFYLNILSSPYIIRPDLILPFWLIWLFYYY